MEPFKSAKEIQQKFKLLAQAINSLNTSTRKLERLVILFILQSCDVHVVEPSGLLEFAELGVAVGDRAISLGHTGILSRPLRYIQHH